IAVPGLAPSPDGGGDRAGLELLDGPQEAVFAAEADDDLRDAEEEGLGPELQELALELVAVSLVEDLLAGFQLYPVDRVVPVFGLVVPD
ncbi:hypothetical protein GP486_008103, partial [Trichoglossum hirsutum]